MAKFTAYAIPTHVTEDLDHTFVVVDDEIYFHCFGRASAEVVKQSRALVEGKGSSSRSLCYATDDGTTGVRYGIDGVCHQVSNRILMGMEDPGLVLFAGGGILSSLTYGFYGKGFYPNFCSVIDGDAEIENPPLHVGPEDFSPSQLVGAGAQLVGTGAGKDETVKQKKEKRVITALEKEVVDLHLGLRSNAIRSITSYSETGREVGELEIVLRHRGESVPEEVKLRILAEKERFILRREGMKFEHLEKKPAPALFMRNFRKLSNNFLRKIQKLLGKNWIEVVGDVEPSVDSLVEDDQFSMLNHCEIK